MMESMSTDRLMILVAAAIFAAIAWYFPQAGPWLKKRRIRQPHPVMTIVFRLWFAALAVASVVLLFMPLPHHR